MITWILEANISDGKVDELQQFLASIGETVKANEPGTLGYEFFLNDDRSGLQLIETYADSDAALAHLGGFGEIAEQFMSLVEVTKFTVYGNPNETVRGAIAGFNPTYLSSFGGFRR